MGVFAPPSGGGGLYMKQKFYIVLLLLWVGLASAYAQSTFDRPLRGATHTYSATVADGGAPNPVRWYVATDALGAVKAAHGTDYTFVTSGYNGATQQLEASAVYNVQVQWGTNLPVGTNYYVFIEVDDDVSNCTNRMALPVQVSADFNALAYNVTGSATPGTAVPGIDLTITAETCPDDVTNPIWNGTGHTDIGTTQMVFRVERQYSLQAWQFAFNITETTAQPISVSDVRVVTQGGTEIYNAAGASATITGIAADQNYVLVYVEVQNQQNKTLALNFSLDATNTKDADNLTDSKASDNSALHTIKPMPAITGFGGN